MYVVCICAEKSILNGYAFRHMEFQINVEKVGKLVCYSMMVLVFAFLFDNTTI